MIRKCPTLPVFIPSIHEVIKFHNMKCITEYKILLHISKYIVTYFQ